MSELESPGKPEMALVGDAYRIVWPCAIEAEIDRMSEHRDELTADVTIRSSRAPKPGLLHSARLNLMSTQARTTLGRALMVREPDLDWGEIIEGLCFLSRERYRAGEPSIDLRFYERVPSRQLLLVEPFVEYGGPTVIAAHGGSGKSRLATAIALTAAGVPIVGRLHGDPVSVMFADWETDTATTAEAIDATLAGAGVTDHPPIHYRRMVASLAESAAAVKREIVRLGIGLFVGDSIGFARGGEPESAEMTLKLFAAARSLGIPVLFTDHVTNAEAKDPQGAKKPFGSAYTWNASRIVWTMDKADDEGTNAITVGLKNRKRNNGQRWPNLGYRIEFENGAEEQLRAIRFKRVQDLAAVPGLAETQSLRDRILFELRRGPVLPEAIAEELEADKKQVSSRVGEMVKAGTLVRLEDRRVALAARVS